MSHKASIAISSSRSSASYIASLTFSTHSLTCGSVNRLTSAWSSTLSTISMFLFNWRRSESLSFYPLMKLRTSEEANLSKRTWKEAKTKCDAPKPEGPLTTRQLAEYSWMSGNPTPLMKIGKSLPCTGSFTQGTKPVPTIYNDHTWSTCE